MSHPARATVGCLALLAGILVLAACSGSSTPRPSPSPSQAVEAPSFTLTVDGEPYAVDPHAATNSCRTPDSGPWSYLYTGVDPFMTIDMTAYQGAASDPRSDDLELYLELGGDVAMQMTPTGRREEAAGDAQLTVSRTGDGSRVELTGTAEGRGGTRGRTSTIELVLTCPS